MIAYFDTSALVPLIVSEPGSAAARLLWDGASRSVSARLAYAEGRAAIAHAHRLDRLTARQLRAAVRRFEELWGALDVVEIDEELVFEAGELAETHALGAYDAVHLAAAVRMVDAELVVAAGDGRLLAAALALGLQTARVA